MGDRRNALLDAAITLLGEKGVHAVTHRAVDGAAGLPAGSTSNVFRTRTALLSGVIQRFAERERANVERLARTPYPASVAELAEILTQTARDAVGPNRSLTLARYALLVEGAIHPLLQPQLAITGGEVSAFFDNWLRAVGSTNTGLHQHIIGNYMTGLALHQLANPDPAFDPAPKVEALLRVLLDRVPVP